MLSRRYGHVRLKLMSILWFCRLYWHQKYLFLETFRQKIHFVANFLSQFLKQPPVSSPPILAPAQISQYFEVQPGGFPKKYQIQGVQLCAFSKIITWYAGTLQKMLTCQKQAH